ncbi:hypothetical protein CBR_g32459 [Chara braunii]|uniref:PsbP C-terminal domain-containing protein n=1 Tax=Chara braunii TaxID=69332 RepID=A0A388LGN8_CHABU|nr:hypothetical protein CBR_g32459 [Chara braunii]|eukprot:GBG81469.1 hypothetical protein CBR_g32459 [Chara braunii]
MEEQAAKLKKIEEEMAREKERLKREEEEKLKAVEEEEEVEEQPLERRRAGGRGESRGTKEDKMEKKITEWVAGLSLAEEVEALMYVPREEQEATMREWDAEEDPLKRRAIEDEKRMEWKFRLTRERKRRMGAASQAAKGLEEVKKQREQMATQVDLLGNMEIMARNIEHLAPVQEKQYLFGRGQDIAVRSIRLGLRDFARELATQVGSESRDPSKQSGYNDERDSQAMGEEGEKEEESEEEEEDDDGEWADEEDEDQDALDWWVRCVQLLAGERRVECEGSADLCSWFLRYPVGNGRRSWGGSYSCKLPGKECCADAESFAFKALISTGGHGSDQLMGHERHPPMGGAIPASHRGISCSLREKSEESCFAALNTQLCGNNRSCTLRPSAAMERMPEGRYRRPCCGERELKAVAKDGLVTVMAGGDVAAEAQDLVRVQRRSILLSGALVAGVVSSFPSCCDADDKSALSLVKQPPSALNTEESVSTERDVASSSGSGPTERGGRWLVIRSKEYSVSLPPGFEDVLQEEEAPTLPRSTLTGGGGSSNGGGGATLLLRFSSTLMPATISLVKRQVAGMRLTFFQANDIGDLGTVAGVADLFVPPGAKLLSLSSSTSSASSVDRSNGEQPADDKPQRNYYQYEFLHRRQHVALRAAVNRGQVYVLGGTTPQENWMAVSEQMRGALDSFRLG